MAKCRPESSHVDFQSMETFFLVVNWQWMLYVNFTANGLWKAYIILLNMAIEERIMSPLPNLCQNSLMVGENYILIVFVSHLPEKPVSERGCPKWQIQME